MVGTKTIEIPDFKGFSPESLKCLKSLKRNSRREWLQPSKEKYKKLLRLPMMALIALLGKECRQFGIW